MFKRDDIIRMAHEAGLCDANGEDDDSVNISSHLERFAALIIAAKDAEPECLMSTRHPETRPCTCHPDDNPPTPCARRYALTECREADRAWTNEVLRLIQRHAPHIPMSEYGDEARATFIVFACAVAALVTAAKDAEHQQTLALQQRSYEREIQLEVEAEREACAEVADGFDACDPKHIAAAIRARTP